MSLMPFLPTQPFSKRIKPLFLIACLSLFFYTCKSPKNANFIGTRIETGIQYKKANTAFTASPLTRDVQPYLQQYQGLSEAQLSRLPEVQIIDPNTTGGWDKTGINGLQKRVFLFKPGNYNNWGTLHINRSGTADAYRLFLYYNPLLSNPFTPQHPAHLSEAASVIIKNFRLSRTNYCLLHNLTIKPDNPKVNDANTNVLVAKANHNIINRCLFEKNNKTALHIQFSDYNVVQNSVIRECLQRPGADNIGIVIFGEKSESNYNHLLNNEIYNCTQGIQLEYRTAYAPLGYCSGTVIENNDVYITPDLYRVKGKDTLACAEMGIVLKIGGKDQQKENIVRVTNNRVWGFRKTDKSCSGDGGSQGAGIELTDYTNHVIVQDNKVFDLPIGIKITSKDPRLFREKTANVALLNNLVFDIRKRASIDNPVGIFVSGSVDILYNTVAYAAEGIQFDDASKLELKRFVQCNNFLNIDRSFYLNSKKNNDLRLNVVYAKKAQRAAQRKAPPEVENTLYLKDTKESAWSDYKFMIKQWTNPTELVVRQVIPKQGFQLSTAKYKEPCDCSAQGNGNRWWSSFYFNGNK